MGGGAWQPPGECPRRAPKPAPPLTRDSLPLLLWRGGGRGPEARPRKEAQAPRRGAGAACFCPFWRRSSGRCPLLPLGPERGEARRAGDRGGLLPSPSGAAGLQLPPEGGQARGRGAPSRGGRARSGARGLDGFHCLRERVCVLTAAAAAAGPCPAGAAPARFRGAGPEPGIRGRREGGGGGGARRRRRYNPLPAAGRLHTRAPEEPAQLRHAGPARASCSPGGAGSVLRPPQARAARPRAGGRRLPSGAAAGAARLGPAEGGARRRSRGRAAEGRTQAAGPRRAGPRRARPGGGGGESRPEASSGPAVGAQGRPQPAGSARAGGWAWRGVQTGDGRRGGGGSSLAPGSFSGLTPANMQNYRPGRS